MRPGAIRARRCRTQRGANCGFSGLLKSTRFNDPADGAELIDGWHRTLRVTPAMDSGITNRVWKISGLLKAS